MRAGLVSITFRKLSVPEIVDAAVKAGETIAAKGPVDSIEMMRVFNMGIGFVMIVAPTFASSIMNRLRRMGERCWVLGKVRKGGPGLLWA